MTNSPTDPDMTYIQNKLDEFHHKFCEFTDGGVLVHYCKDGNCLDEFITQIFTDYHNHIKTIMNDIIEIEYHYNKEGYLVKKLANEKPLWIPKQIAPSVQFFDKDVEWVIEKSLMTKQEVENIWGKNSLSLLQDTNPKE